MFGRFLKHRMVKRVSGLIVLCAFFANFVIADAGAVEIVTLDLYRIMFPEETEESFAELDIETLELPSNLGTVRLESKGESGKFVVHIQDAHCNYAAQKKINEIIAFFANEYGVENVNLEGGAGVYDLSIFTDIRDREVRKNVSDHFVAQGLVNGAEDFAINNPEKVKLWGLEDPGLYMKNLSVYRGSLQYKGEVDERLKGLTHVMDNLKRQIYSTELYELDRQYSQFKSNGIKFKEYLSYLVQKAKYHLIDTRAYPNLYLLYQSMEQEEDIDFKKANTQRDELVERLRGTLSKRALEELVLKTVAFKQKRMSRFEYYDLLVKKAKFADISLDEYPEFRKYFVYISLYHAADRSMVMKEMGQMEDAVKDVLYQNDTQRELNVLSKNLTLLANLFDISLTKDDYNYYRKNRSAFDMRNYSSFIKREAPRYKIRTEPAEGLETIDRHRGDLEKFFEYSFDRDDRFIENITFTRRANDVAIVVTGGFHTENLCDLYRKKGYSYISIMPNFRNEKGYECPYFDLLAGKEAGMQKVLAGAIAGNMIQIASLLQATTDLQGAWGRANVDAFRAAVYIQAEIAQGRQVALQLPNGEVLNFGDRSAPTVTMSLNRLMDAVHQREMDEPIRRAYEAGKYEAVSQDARNAAADRINEIASRLAGVNAQRLRDLAEAIRSGTVAINIVDVGTTDFEGHAGGRGIHINSAYAGNAVDIIVHEAIAGIAGDHFIASEAVRSAENAAKMIASAELFDNPVWEMEAAARAEVARDFAAREEATALGKAIAPVIERQPSEFRKTYSDLIQYLDNYIITSNDTLLQFAANSVRDAMLRDKIGRQFDSGETAKAVQNIAGLIDFINKAGAEMIRQSPADMKADAAAFVSEIQDYVTDALVDRMADPAVALAFWGNPAIRDHMLRSVNEKEAMVFTHLMMRLDKVDESTRAKSVELAGAILAGEGPVIKKRVEAERMLQEALAAERAAREAESREEGIKQVQIETQYTLETDKNGEQKLVPVESAVKTVTMKEGRGYLIRRVFYEEARLRAQGKAATADKMHVIGMEMLRDAMREALPVEEVEESPVEAARDIVAPAVEGAEAPAAEAEIFGDMNSIVEKMPDKITGLLIDHGLNTSELAAAVEVMDSVGEIYKGMGLLTENYHNHAHNLAVTYAMMALSKGENIRDTKVAFLAALFHDFHERNRTRTRGDGKVTGSPALVDETMLQIADLFGLATYRGPARGDAGEKDYANYQRDGASTKALRAALEKFLDTSFPGEDRADVFAEMETMIRRTDFASNVAPPEAEYKSMAADLRRMIESRFAGRPELTDNDISKAIADLRKGYGNILTEVGRNKEASDAAWMSRQTNWLKRQLGIEEKFLDSLRGIKSPSQRAKMYDLAFRLEKGGDQSGFYWVTSAGQNGGAMKVVEGLGREIPEVGPAGTYQFFLTPELNSDNGVLAVMNRLDPEFRENYLEVNRTFAEMGGESAKNLWNTVKGRLTLMLGLGAEGEVAPVPFSGLVGDAPQVTEFELDMTERVINILALQEGGDVTRMASLDDRAKLAVKLNDFVKAIDRAGELLQKMAVGRELSDAEFDEILELDNRLSLTVYQVMRMAGWKEYGRLSAEEAWQNPELLARVRKVFEGWMARNERYGMGEWAAAYQAETQKRSYKLTLEATPEASAADLDAVKDMIAAITIANPGQLSDAEIRQADIYDMKMDTRADIEAKLNSEMERIDQMAAFVARLNRGEAFTESDKETLDRMKGILNPMLNKMATKLGWDTAGTPTPELWRNFAVLAQARKVFEGWIARNKSYGVGEWAARAAYEQEARKKAAEKMQPVRAAFGEVTFENILKLTPEASDAELDMTGGLISAIARGDLSNMNPEGRLFLEEQLRNEIDNIDKLADAAIKTNMGETPEVDGRLRAITAMTVYRVFNIVRWEGLGEPSTDSWQDPQVLAKVRRILEGWQAKNRSFLMRDWAQGAEKKIDSVLNQAEMNRIREQRETERLEEISALLAEADNPTPGHRDKALTLLGLIYRMDRAVGNEGLYHGFVGTSRLILREASAKALVAIARYPAQDFYRDGRYNLDGYAREINKARAELARSRVLSDIVDRLGESDITPGELADYRKVRAEAVGGKLETTAMILAANKVQRIIDEAMIDHADDLYFDNSAGSLVWINEYLDVAYPASLLRSAEEAIRDFRTAPSRNMDQLAAAVKAVNMLEGYEDALSRMVGYEPSRAVKDITAQAAALKSELDAEIAKAGENYRDRLNAAYGMLNAVDVMVENAVMEGALDWNRLNGPLNQAFDIERNNARYRDMGLFDAILDPAEAGAFEKRFADTKSRIYNFVNAKRDYINSLDSTPEIFRALGVTLGTTPEDLRLASIAPEDLKARINAVHDLGYSIYNGVGLALLRNSVDDLRARAEVKNAFETAETPDEAVAAMEMAGNKVKGLNGVYAGKNGLARLGEFVDTMRRSGVDIYGHSLTLLQYGPDIVYERTRMLERYGIALNMKNLTSSDEKIRAAAVQQAGTIAAVLGIVKDGKLAAEGADPAEIDGVDAVLRAEIARMDLSGEEGEAVLKAMKEVGYENLKGMDVARLREMAISRAGSVDKILGILNADNAARSAQVVVFLRRMEADQRSRAEEGENHAATRLDVMLQDIARNGFDVYGKGEGLGILSANLLNIIKGMELWDVVERKSKGISAERTKIRKDFNDIQKTLYESFTKFIGTDAGKALLAATVTKEGLTGDDINLEKPENTANRLRVMAGLKKTLTDMPQYGVQQDMAIEMALPSFDREQRFLEILTRYRDIVMDGGPNVRERLRDLRNENVFEYDNLLIEMIKTHIADLKAEGLTWEHKPFVLSNIDPPSQLMAKYRERMEGIKAKREAMRGKLTAEIKGPASRTEAPAEEGKPAEEKKTDESAAVANGTLKDALESARSLEELRGTIGEEAAMDDTMGGKLNAALDYLYDELRRGKIEGEDLNIMVELMTGRVDAGQGERDAAREGIINSVYLFNANVEGEENYLLGFNKFDRIGISAELVRSLSARELAELLFHELYEPGIGHDAIYGKYNRAESIQGKIFGESNPLKDSLRNFINMKAGEFKMAKALAAGERPVEAAAEAPEGAGADMESRKANDIRAGEEIERRTDPVKIVVAGVYDLDNPDAFRSMEKAVRKFNSEIKTKFGEQADNQQIIVFRIEKDNPAATADNYRKAMDRAMKELDRLPAEAKARLVSYTPQMEGMELADNVMDEAKPEFAQYRTDPRVTLVRDGYTDAFARGEARAVDIAARFILGRQIAFCFNADNDAARMEGLRRVRNTLSMLAGEEVVATLNNLDDLKNFLANNIININPIDYEEIRDYEDMQLAVAVSL